MGEQPPQLQAGAGTTWCKYHCVTCDECFRSLVAFDAHRKGSFYRNTRHCVDPESLVRAADGEPTLEGLEGKCKRTNTLGVWVTTVYRLAGNEEEEE